MNKKKARRKLKRKTRGNSESRSLCKTIGFASRSLVKNHYRKLFTIDLNAGLIPIKEQNSILKLGDVQ